MYMTSKGQKIQLNQDKRENYTSPSPSKPDTSKTWIIALIVVAAIFLFFVLKFGWKTNEHVPK